ncbi:uncharacterized protein LOC123257469 [Drosophila ananassae]|uniref:uncharacterized protein LOC123257469 n=1 Tax=Drosophila ananassae TaxID=7217 RepID=UPI001CFF76CA|nr:uncharacterized protein LOC123257469 [Drosophila ananassae]
MERYLKRTSKSDENVEEPAPGPKKKREASVAWDHFKKDVRKTHGVCNYCGKAIKTNGNTTNLLDHLRHMHPDRLKVGKGQNDNATVSIPRQQPAPPTEEPTRFSFMKSKLDAKVQSFRADAIVLLRQHVEKENQPEKCEPLAYWEMSTEEAFKILSKKYFCVPASSCESERVFSKAGQLISDRRTRLSSSVVDKLLFLNKNKHINKI